MRFLFYVAPRRPHSPPAVLLLDMCINSSLPTSCLSGVAIYLHCSSQKLLQNGHVLITFGKVQNPLRLPQKISITLLRVIPTMAFNSSHLTIYLAYLYGIPSGMSSDIPSGISSDILSGISSDILSVISSDILSVISSDILSGISSVILSGILSDILSGISSYILSGILSGVSSDILSGISSDILSAISSDILSGISSDILSGISSDILFGIAFGIGVEVRQRTLGVDGRG